MGMPLQLFALEFVHSPHYRIRLAEKIARLRREAEPVQTSCWSKFERWGRIPAKNPEGDEPGLSGAVSHAKLQGYLLVAGAGGWWSGLMQASLRLRNEVDGDGKSWSGLESNSSRGGCP